MAKVLVVDDSLSVRTLVERALKSKRVEVLSAASGAEALAQIKGEEPDLVVCDVIMPDMEGYRICEHVRNDPRLARTPVLLMSGIVNASVLARAAEVGATDVIRKPFAADELVDKVGNLLASGPRSATLPAPAAGDLLAAPSASPHRAPWAEESDSGEVLRDLLGGISEVSGVCLAILVDRDGCLIESSGDMALEADVAGALAACLAESSEGIGRELKQGALSSMVLEYEGGLVLVNAVASSALLVTLLSDSALLSKVRYYVKKALPDLGAAL
jgi:CheY-like chemotaxis protein